MAYCENGGNNKGEEKGSIMDKNGELISTVDRNLPVKNVATGNGVCLETPVSQCSIDLVVSGYSEGNCIEHESTNAIPSVENISRKVKGMEGEVSVENNFQSGIAGSFCGMESTSTQNNEEKQGMQIDLCPKFEDCLMMKADPREYECTELTVFENKRKRKKQNNNGVVSESTANGRLKDSNDSEDMIDSVLGEMQDGDTSSLHDKLMEKDVSEKKREIDKGKEKSIIVVSNDNNDGCSGVVHLNLVEAEGNARVSKNQILMKGNTNKDKDNLVLLEKQRNQETCLDTANKINSIELGSGEVATDGCKKIMETDDDIPMTNGSNKLNSVDVKLQQDMTERENVGKFPSPNVDMVSLEVNEIVPQVPNFLEVPRAGRASKKLLILDVNGLLADIVPHCPDLTKWPPDTFISGKPVYKRRYCDDFLRFCFDKFNVGIWSSRIRRNMDMVLDFLLGFSRRKLLFCWDQSHCTYTGFTTVENHDKPLLLKELRKLWESQNRYLPWRKGDYDESNTLLLDDSPYKALRNPANTAIFPRTYKYNNTRDYSLGRGGDLRLYLEQLAEAQNVQEYVAKNPFGKRAITESNPSWGFYQKIMDPNSCPQSQGTSSNATFWVQLK